MLMNFMLQLCIKKLDLKLIKKLYLLNVKILTETVLQIYNIYMIKLLLINSYNKKEKQLINIITANITDYKLILSML